jgi:Ca2+:H+ antiporter
MTPTDVTPLLENGADAGNAHHSYTQRVVNFIKADGEPSWLDSYKYFLFGSWWNAMLFFIPLSIISHQLHWDAALRFSFSFFAIVPLAKV